MQALRLVLVGIVIGIANLIPGVSGGTLAVVFSVYDSLIDLIGLNIKKILSQWKFWLPLAAGIALGIVFFSKLINRLLELYPSSALWFFTGIIAGSLPFIAVKTYKETNAKIEHTENENKKSGGEKSRIILRRVSVSAACVLAFTLMLYIKYLNKENFTQSAQINGGFALQVKLCVSTALAAAAMIIPGISGSFLMLIFGTYNTVIRAVADLNFVLLLPVALGACAGLLGGAALIRLLLRKFCAQTYSAILGLVAGSLFVMFPGIPATGAALFSADRLLGTVLSIVLCIAGFAAAYLSGKNGGREGGR